MYTCIFNYRDFIKMYFVRYVIFLLLSFFSLYSTVYILFVLRYNEYRNKWLSSNNATAACFDQKIL